MTPRVSVIVPTYNRAQFLAEALDSLFAQTLPPHEVILVNDGCDDRTHAVIEPYRSRLLYIEQPNLNKAQALNVAIPRATGDYIWIFDDDDVALPDALQRFVAPLETHPALGFSYSTFYFTGSRDDGRIGDVQGVFELPDVSPDDLFPLLMENCFLCGAGFFARAACCREVLPIDPELVRCQDYDLALRVSRKWRGIRIEGGPTFHYRQHGCQRGSSADHFDPTLKYDKWQEYGRRIAHRLRRDLDIKEYLPPPVVTDHLASTLLRRAYFQRMTVMGARGLLAEMVDDLRSALAASDAPLSPEERAMLQRLPGYQLPGSEFFSAANIRRIKSECRSHAGRQVVTELLRGLYWRLPVARKKRQRGHVREILRAIWYLLGVRSAFQLSQQRSLEPASPRR